MFINPCSLLPSFASSMTKHSNDLRQLYLSIAIEWLMRCRHWCNTLWTPERTSQEKTCFYIFVNVLYFTKQWCLWMNVVFLIYWSEVLKFT